MYVNMASLKHKIRYLDCITNRHILIFAPVKTSFRTPCHEQRAILPFFYVRNTLEEL